MKKLYKDDISGITEEEYANLERLAPTDVADKIRKMKNAGDRMRTLAGYRLILRAASEFCGAENPQMARTANGKPYFTGLPLKFSLSHCESRVVLALSDAEIGADIEKIRPTNANIAKRFFCRNEQEYIFSAYDADERSARFFEIWTKREAWFKQRGSGIGAADEIDTLSLDFYTERDGDFIISVYEE